ncbi:MAG: thioredoxin [Candidatus Woesearchaeota archaeon]
MQQSKIIDYEVFKKEVLESKIPVVVDFWAEWCNPCKALSPVLEELSKEYDGILKFYKINTEENPELTQMYKIKGIPALLFFKDGNLVGNFVGFAPKHYLKKVIDDFINNK